VSIFILPPQDAMSDGEESQEEIEGYIKATKEAANFLLQSCSTKDDKN